MNGSGSYVRQSMANRASKVATLEATGETFAEREASQAGA